MDAKAAAEQSFKRLERDRFLPEELTPQMQVDAIRANPQGYAKLHSISLEEVEEIASRIEASIQTEK